MTDLYQLSAVAAKRASGSARARRGVVVVKYESGYATYAQIAEDLGRHEHSVRRVIKILRGRGVREFTRAMLTS